MPSRKSAIPPDDLLDRDLGSMSAADLITALSHPDIDRRAVMLLPDKKKYELWIDEDAVLKVKLVDLIDRLRTEKKKIELEKQVIEIPNYQIAPYLVLATFSTLKI